MIVTKKQLPSRIRTTPLSIFVASPFGGDGNSHVKLKNNSPGTPLRAGCSTSRTGALKLTPQMKSSTASQPHKRTPQSSRSGLTVRSHSTPSLVEDQRNEQCSAKLSTSGSTSARKGRPPTARLHNQSGGASCRKKLAVDDVPLKNYHSETSLNNLLSAPLTFGKDDTKENSREEPTKLVVGVRVRPLSAAEKSNPSVTDVVAVQGDEVVVSYDQTKYHFTYDYCFWSSYPGNVQFATQEDVFVAIVVPLVHKVFEGYNACLFAYGQTGSGKSYSMMGENLESLERSWQEPPAEVGIIPRFCHELFDRIALKGGDSENKTESNWKVEITYYEVYNEKIHDLLDECGSANKKCLRVREHPSLGPYVEDLAIKEVHSLGEVLDWLKIGNNQRFTASTEMNEKSSRSHSIFSLTLTQTQMELVMGESMMNTRSSRCNLVDLAGSERVAQTCSIGERRKEGVSINQSLLTLGKVISALAENGSSRKCFAPYRESVLTFLLKESLGGNSRTVMLATISPASTHVDETVATLRYACQARKIVNRVRVNEVPQISVIRALTEDVARLNALREQHELHMRDCQQRGSESLELREELVKLRLQYDEHLRGCTVPQGACPRVECAEAVQRCELQLAECRSHHREEVARLKDELERLGQQADGRRSAEQCCRVDELKEELSVAREEYDLHLRSCKLDGDSEVKKLRAELQRVNDEQSELKSSGLAEEVHVLRTECSEWRDKYTKLEEEFNDSQQTRAQQDKEFCELKLQRVKEFSHLGNEVDNFKVQLKNIQTRIDDLPLLEEHALPSHDIDAATYRAMILQKLKSALTESTNPSACEFTLSPEDTLPGHLFTKDNTYTVTDADLSSPQSNSTMGRFSTGTDTSETSLDHTQSFVSQSSSGNAEESVEEVLYYLEDKTNRLKELCGGENAAVIAVFDQALSELREALQAPSTWDLSKHFSPPSPSVTPAKSNLRPPEATRAPTPKSVTFQLHTDT